MASLAGPDPDSLPPHPHLDHFYDDASRRRTYVHELFDHSASSYEWIAKAMSLGSGGWYRRAALKRAGLEAGHELLDVATGTGPVARAGRKILGEHGRIVGLDPSFGMLREQRRRFRVIPLRGLAEELPIRDGSFDLLSMGYALRHVADLRLTFREFYRVLRPGGRLLVLELTPPRSATGFRFMRFYLKTVVPGITLLLSRSRQAAKLMRYHWETIERCVPPEQILAAMDAAGFGEVQRYVTGGIFSEYRGRRD